MSKPELAHVDDSLPHATKPTSLVLPDHSLSIAQPASPAAPPLIGNQYSIADCRVIYLPRIQDARGNLTFIEADRHIPFAMKRTYHLYDVPGGSERGGHAHRQLHEFIVAMSGSFDVILDDGYSKQRFHLNRSYYGLYACPMVWRSLENFSSGSVCMVLASDYYDESDYYRDYEEYKTVRRAA